MPSSTDPKPTSFTFNGETVQFSASQKARLDADLDKIDAQQAIINSQQAAYNGAVANYNTASSNKNNAVNINCGSNSPLNNNYENCMYNRQAQINVFQNKMNSYAGQRDVAKSQWDSAVIALAAEVDNYNTDLAAIQNDIKIQIQAMQANNATTAQNTQNTSALDPTLNAQNLAAQAAKEKQAQQTKIITYSIFGVLIVVIIIVVIKKLF